MQPRQGQFATYVFSRQNRLYWIFAVGVGITYFIALRSLFPVISFYSDSFTWIGAAESGQPITMRPIGYSKLLLLFRHFSQSDIALVSAQYLCNILANLFLFFTCTWLFRFSKTARIGLYLLLLLNPFYALYSNYLSSDAFFNCLAVLWFTVLMWMIRKPFWPIILLQLLVLAALFWLRYNAIFFPAVTAVALLLCTLRPLRKIFWSVCGYAVVTGIVYYTTNITENFTGTRTFSAFSGWQLANNALHIVSHERIDTTAIQDKQAKELLAYCLPYLHVSKLAADTGASAFYMWDASSPLKHYVNLYSRRQKSYFGTWTALGPVYARFGTAIILQKPGAYFRYFVVPNVGMYFLPRLEIYQDYMEHRDTIPPVAMDFYHYSSNKVSPGHPLVYALVTRPVQYLFTAVNILLAVLSAVYFTGRFYRVQPPLYSRLLLCFSALCLLNFCFIVLLAPSVIRYHIFILTLSYPMLLYVVPAIFKSPKRGGGIDIVTNT